MAKRITLFLLQFIAFLGLMFIGGNWDVIRLGQELRALTTHTAFWNPIPTIKYPIGNHILVADGILFGAALLILILLFETLRRALRPYASISFLSYILAVVLGLALKFGLPPANQ
jgi:hypothetical protein